MQTNIFYIGLDVDDNSYHGCGFKPDSSENPGGWTKAFGCII